MSWNGWISELAYSTDDSYLETYVTRITSYIIILGTGYFLAQMAESSLCLASVSSAATTM